MMAHGANNVWEGSSGSDGYVREGYRFVASQVIGDARYGDLAYGTVDIGTSFAGFAKGIAKKATLNNYPYMNSSFGIKYKDDLVPAFTTMSNTAFGFEILNMINANNTSDNYPDK